MCIWLLTRVLRQGCYVWEQAWDVYQCYYHHDHQHHKHKIRVKHSKCLWWGYFLIIQLLFQIFRVALLNDGNEKVVLHSITFWKCSYLICLKHWTNWPLYVMAKYNYWLLFDRKRSESFVFVIIKFHLHLISYWKDNMHYRKAA